MTRIMLVLLLMAGSAYAQETLPPPRPLDGKPAKKYEPPPVTMPKMPAIPPNEIKERPLAFGHVELTVTTSGGTPLYLDTDENKVLLETWLVKHYPAAEPFQWIYEGRRIAALVIRSKPQLYLTEQHKPPK